MYLFLQFFRQSIKTELTGTFYQYNLILQPQFSTGNSAQQGFCIRIESLLDVKACGTRRYLTAYSDDTLNAAATGKLRYFPVKRRRILSGFQYIREDKSPLQSVTLRTTVKKIECNVQ